MVHSCLYLQGWLYEKPCRLLKAIQASFHSVHRTTSSTTQRETGVTLFTSVMWWWTTPTTTWTTTLATTSCLHTTVTTNRRSRSLHAQDFWETTPQHFWRALSRLGGADLSLRTTTLSMSTTILRWRPIPGWCECAPEWLGILHWLKKTVTNCFFLWL